MIRNETIRRNKEKEKRGRSTEVRDGDNKDDAKQGGDWLKVRKEYGGREERRDEQSRSEG